LIRHRSFTAATAFNRKIGHSENCPMKKRPFLLGFLSLAGTMFFSGMACILQPIPVSAEDASLTLSAAISLKPALEELQPLYRRIAPNLRVVYNFGASGALQQQIEQGAPVDVFISAASKQMDALQSKDLILPGTRRNLLTNQLVLIVPKRSMGVLNLRQLTSPQVKRIAMGEPRSVPVGQYAEEVFKKLGIFTQVKPKLVLGSSVLQVLTTVASGNVDAGIVYITDAKTSNQVKVVEIIAAKMHSPIVYPIAILKTSKQQAAAKAFVQYLSSNQARTVFKKYGFAIAQ
jgi:molybdate transport system substrate-binding protein